MNASFIDCYGVIRAAVERVIANNCHWWSAECCVRAKTFPSRSLSVSLTINKQKRLEVTNPTVWRTTKPALVQSNTQRSQTQVSVHSDIIYLHTKTRGLLLLWNASSPNVHSLRRAQLHWLVFDITDQQIRRPRMLIRCIAGKLPLKIYKRDAIGTLFVVSLPSLQEGRIQWNIFFELIDSYSYGL